MNERLYRGALGAQTLQTRGALISLPGTIVQGQGLYLHPEIFQAGKRGDIAQAVAVMLRDNVPIEVATMEYTSGVRSVRATRYWKKS